MTHATWCANQPPPQLQLTTCTIATHSSINDNMSYRQTPSLNVAITLLFFLAHVTSHPYHPQYTLGLSYHAHADASVTEDNVSPLPPTSSLFHLREELEHQEEEDHEDKRKELAKLLAATFMQHDDLKERLEQIIMDSAIEEDESDDDDDDDDGHSSMLSTSAYYRSSSAHVAVSIATVSADGHLSDRGAARSTALAMRGGASLGENEMIRRLLVAALVTLLYEGFIGHILEFVKIVMQTSTPGTSYGQVLRTITADKGIAGLWDGFVPWGVIQSLFKGSVFGIAHHSAKDILVGLSNEGYLPLQLALTLAGGVGGGFQGYILSPTLLLKTRVMTDPVFREQMSMLRTTYLSLKIGFDVITKEGLTALMKGSNIFALKRVFDWSTRFYFADVFSKIFLALSKAESLNAKQKISADLLGGVFSTISTLPLDVMVAKVQDAKKAGVKISPLEMFQSELNERGWEGLKASYLQGFEARLLHVCFTTVVMKTGTGVMYDMLYNR